MIRSIDKNAAYERPSSLAIVGGSIAGFAFTPISNIGINFLDQKIMGQVIKLSNDLNADEFMTVDTAINKALNDSGLAGKGVRIIKSTDENAKEWEPKIGKSQFLRIKSGKDARHFPRAKIIFRPEKGLSLAMFHEMGHAANFNLSNSGKLTMKTEKVKFLRLPLLLIALLKTKNNPNQKPKSAVGKTTTFIKENAGKLMFLTFIPLLVEEGLASVRGKLFAEKLLAPALLKKVTKTNGLGFLSYLGLATLSSLGLYLGVKVKDSIAKPKLIEQGKTKV